MIQYRFAAFVRPRPPLWWVALVFAVLVSIAAVIAVLLVAFAGCPPWIGVAFGLPAGLVTPVTASDTWAMLHRR